jgi:hypothetical protein
MKLALACAALALVAGCTSRSYSVPLASTDPITGVPVQYLVHREQTLTDQILPYSRWSIRQVNGQTRVTVSIRGESDWPEITSAADADGAALELRRIGRYAQVDYGLGCWEIVEFDLPPGYFTDRCERGVALKVQHAGGVEQIEYSKYVVQEFVRVHRDLNL